LAVCNTHIALSRLQGRGCSGLTTGEPAWTQPGCTARLQPQGNNSSPVVDLMLQCWPLGAVAPGQSDPGTSLCVLRSCCSGTPSSATILAVRFRRCVLT
jgi:hypothetical protein